VDKQSTSPQSPLSKHLHTCTQSTIITPGLEAILPAFHCSNSVILNTPAIPFLPEIKVPTDPIGRAERESHNNVITFPGSQDVLKGRGTQEPWLKSKAGLVLLKSRLGEQGSQDYPGTVHDVMAHSPSVQHHNTHKNQGAVLIQANRQ
jgi:hypothetical protein